MQAISGVHIWLIVMKAFQSMSAYTERTLDGSGLGDSDFRVLEALLHKGPLPVNVIGPKVFLTPGSISAAVDRLHERGLVSRTESKTDRRVRVVDLTREGRALIEGVFRVHAKDMGKLAEVLTPAERIHLVKALKKLGKHALAVLDQTQTDFEPEERKRRAMPVMSARPLKERFGPPV